MPPGADRQTVCVEGNATVSDRAAPVPEPTPEPLSAPAPPPDEAAPRSAAEKADREASATNKVVIWATAVVVAAALTPVGEDVYQSVKDRFNRNDLVVVTVERNPDRIHTKDGPVGGFYVMDLPIDEVGPPPDGADSCVGRYEWAMAKGASTADSTTVRVSLRGRHESRTVEITDVRVVDLKRTSLVTGTHLACGGRGGDTDIRSVVIDLEATPPAISATNEQGEEVAFHFTVGSEEYEVFQITGHAVTCTCEWRVQFVARYGDEVQTVTVPPPDEPPFRTVSSMRSRSYRWQNGQWVDQERMAGGGGGGSPRPFNPATVPSCRVLSQREVDDALGAHADVLSGFNTEGPGASGVPVRESYCTYSVVGSAPPPTPSSVPHDGINVSRTGAADEAAIKREIEERLPRYANGERVEPIAGLGDEAYYTNGLVLVRHDAEFLVVALTVRDAKRERLAVTLARTAARRLWP